MKTDHLMWKEDGWGYLPANKDVFHTFEWIRHHYKPKKILEIGFYAGHSTTYMAQIFKEAHITSCCPDHPRGRQYGEIVMNTFDNVTVHLTPSPEIYDRLKGETFDFVFIDGNHTLAQVKIDTDVAIKFGSRCVLYDNTELPQVRRGIWGEIGKNRLKMIRKFPYRTNFKEGGVNEMRLLEVLDNQ